jgi:hypothetical protein
MARVRGMMSDRRASAMSAKEKGRERLRKFRAKKYEITNDSEEGDTVESIEEEKIEGCDSTDINGDATASYRGGISGVLDGQSMTSTKSGDAVSEDRDDDVVGKISREERFNDKHDARGKEEDVEEEQKEQRMMRTIMSANEELERELNSMREILTERTVETEKMRESLLEMDAVKTELLEKCETLEKAELRARNAEETLLSYANMVSPTTLLKKEESKEESKEEDMQEDVSERDVLISARDAMRRERDAAIAKQRVAENRAEEIEEELRDCEFTIMSLRQDLKSLEEQQQQLQQQQQQQQHNEHNEIENDDEVNIKNNNHDDDDLKLEKKDADMELIVELHAERRKNEQLAEALHKTKEQIAVFKNLSEHSKSFADRAETEADELENAIIASEEKTRRLGKSLIEERRRVKNLRETVDIVTKLVEHMTSEEAVEQKGNAIVPESPFRASKNKTRSRITEEEVLDAELMNGNYEEDKISDFDDETFFEQIIERIKNALDYRFERLESITRERSNKAKELGFLLTEADDEIVEKNNIIEQVQAQRDALLDEIESRDEHLDTIEKDLEQMIESEMKLREEVLTKDALVSNETAKINKLMTLIEEQAMWSPNNSNNNNDETKNENNTNEEIDADHVSDSFELAKRTNIRLAQSAPATPAKTRRIIRTSRDANAVNQKVIKDVYAQLFTTIEKRLVQLREDRKKITSNSLVEIRRN